MNQQRGVERRWMDEQTVERGERMDDDEGREQRAEERKQKRGIGQDTAWWTRRHGRVPRIRNATPHAAYPEQAVRDPAQTA